MKYLTIRLVTLSASIYCSKMTDSTCPQSVTCLTGSSEFQIRLSMGTYLRYPRPDLWVFTDPGVFQIPGAYLGARSGHGYTRGYP